MEQRGDDVGANEQRLFHGCDAATVGLIECNGFDRSYSCVAACGAGVYFARNASYCANTRYAVPNASTRLQTIIVARVLVGHSQLGRRGLKHPETRIGNIPYDSLVNNLDQEASIFVSCHNDNQAYPEYVIEFVSQPTFTQDPQYATPAVSLVDAAVAEIQKWVARGYKDVLGTQGRLELSRLGLTDTDLTATLPHLQAHMPHLLMITLHGNRITTVPMELLNVHITVDTLVVLPATWQGFVGHP
jgi:hypothetical protein